VFPFKWLRLLPDAGRSLDKTDPVDLGEDAALGVLRHHGFGLLVVQVQAVADDGFVVVAPARFLGPAQEAVHQFLVVGGQLEDHVELLVAVGEDLVKVIHLRGGTGVAVQEESVVHVGLAKAVADHLVGHAVRNEVTVVHELLSLEAKRGFTLHVGPEDVTGGDGHNAEAF